MRLRQWVELICLATDLALAAFLVLWAILGLVFLLLATAWLLVWASPAAAAATAAALAVCLGAHLLEARLSRGPR